MQKIRNIANLFLLLFLYSHCNEVGTEDGDKIKVEVGNHHSLFVEIAATPERRERGLMYRTKLRDDEGMLFIFPYPRKVAFWMKNTLIPLDIGYFNPEKRLIEHVTMKPDNGKQTYPSSDIVLYALETNINWFHKNRIKRNTLLKLPHRISAY